MSRATKGGQTGCNGEHYDGGQFLPTTNHPKGGWKAQKAAKEAERKAKAAEFNRKSAAALAIYEGTGRLQAFGHYRETEAAMLAQQDGIWASL